ncbi:type II toxin-antitoxin system death-on-curing family toxin [Dongia sp.]|uniref:type II toxin-antitoxin system death-on-curing family toxin n=1 Tax=Dongia sp. TaxID=1977262 RepID=UPI0035B09CAB
MTGPIWIEEREALILHERLLVLHGGAPGVRDAALLSSALARPRQYAAYTDEADVIFLAALHTAAIVRNHPFVDGNKRTGFVLGILFLELNRYRFTAHQAEAAQAVIALAAGTLDEHQYAAFLAANVARDTGR